jgi:dipeptidyl aminopeptidase/acylaminoacyl peptidase
MKRNRMRKYWLLPAMLWLLIACKENSNETVIADDARIAELMQLDNKGIPVETFFQNPESTSYTISPDGRHIAYLGSYASRMNIYLQANGSADSVRLTSDTDRDIMHYFWKNNATLIYMKDNEGDENYRIFSVDTNSQSRELARFSNVRVNIINELPDKPDEILISMNKNNPALFEPYRLNIVNGSLQQLASNNDLKNPITTWMADNEGKLRIAVSVEQGTTNHLLYRASEKDTFHSILSSNWKDMLLPLFFDADNHHIIALSNLNRDKTALIRLDPDNPAAEEVLYVHRDVDVWWAEQSRRTQTIASVSYITDRKHTIYLDTLLNEVAESVLKLLPGKEIHLSSMDDAGKHFIVRTYADRSPGTYYMFETETGRITKLADVNPKIDEAQMAPMEPVAFTTSDGWQLSGYLTLPPGKSDRNLPTVLMVHGGPLTRDIWGYRPEVQLLANRGYAVLQINYRGSWGFGKKFAEAGFRQWGGTMQNDLTEGVNWLVAKGIADPDRIAIYGASYGGYAALAGLTFTPNQYTCGISYVGPSNLFTLLENLPAYWQPEKEMMYEMIGNPVSDSALLHQVSPVFHADRINDPLFIAQGANDVRVTEMESRQMVDALRNKGVEVVYMLKENEGHGFRLEENRFEFYKALCGFLQLHMPADNQPVNL